jgi:hypothetical protein
MLALFYFEEEFLSHFYPTSKLVPLFIPPAFRPPMRGEVKS